MYGYRIISRSLTAKKELFRTSGGKYVAPQPIENKLKESRLVEQIKTIVIEQVHYTDQSLGENFSTFLAARLNYDYTYLSNLFAANQGITLEHYIIGHKIDKVKELLIYDELTIAEIAFKMNYSSAAHLSKQFKKVTGFTASYFKELKRIRFEENKNKTKKLL